MQIWQLPEVRQAAEAILHAAQIVRLQEPRLPPLRRLQEARRHCVDEILQAQRAMVRAEELARNGAWKILHPGYRTNDKQQFSEHVAKRRAAAAERYQRIREIAAAQPDWSYARIAKEVGCGTTTVCVAMRRK